MRVLAFGDSHQGVWDLVAKDLPDHTLDVLAVDAATAYGIMTNNSRSNARWKFYQHFEKHSAYDLILVGLGEIDCGYLLWTKGESHTRSVVPLLRFMTEISDITSKVVFVAPNPPVVENASIANPEYPKRVPVEADLSDRQRMTALFNEEVSASWPNVMSIWEQVWNPFTGKVFDQFKRKDPRDHHLSWEATSWLWLAELTPYLEN